MNGKPRHKVFQALLVAVLVSGCASSWALASPSYHLIFLLDGSSSMGERLPPPVATPALWWHKLLHRIYGTGSLPGQVDGVTTRLTAVRKVVARYVEGLPPTAFVGLRVLGQRRWRGCEDSERLLDLAPLDLPRFQRTLRWIQPAPIGNSPLAYALRQGARDFVGNPHGNNVLVLITDGQNPCPEALPDGREIASAEGVDMRIHVIDLGLGGKAISDALRRVAESSGGHYAIASDQPTLALALARLLPVTPSQRLASMLHLQPGSWQMVVSAVALLLLLGAAWMLVRSER